MQYHWQDTETEIISGEIWMPLSINSRFSISSFGRIREGHKFRKPYRTNKGGKGNGYVITCINGVRQLIHRLVANHFVPNINPMIYIQVNHKDGDKANNYYSNLEWVTNAVNVKHSFSIGLNSGSCGSKNYFATMSEDKVKAIIRIMSTSTFKNKEAAQYFGIPYSTMRKIKDGTYWQNLNSYRNLFNE